MVVSHAKLHASILSAQEQWKSGNSFRSSFSLFPAVRTAGTTDLFSILLVSHVIKTQHEAREMQDVQKAHPGRTEPDAQQIDEDTQAITRATNEPLVCG